MNVIRRPQATIDIWEIVQTIAQRQPAAAQRFLIALKSLFDDIRRFPGMGRAMEFDDEPLAGIRRCVVPRFRDYLVYYRVFEDRVEIVRVLHGARRQQPALRES